jgi:uncharacterized Zn finger protein
MSSLLTDVLTLRAIQELADVRTFTRGMAYFHDGAVGLLDADEYEARASVQGTQRYRVRLGATTDMCPAAPTDGIPCAMVKASSSGNALRFLPICSGKR